MDVGASINENNPNSTADGWHGGFGLATLTRAADIRSVFLLFFFFNLMTYKNL